MKKISTLLILLVASFVSAQEINWMTLEEATAAQKKEPRKIMIDAYTKWCGPCKMLAKKTFKNKSVVEYVNKNYYAVKFNAEGNEEIKYNGNTFTNPNYDPKKANRRNSAHQLARHLGVSAYPTILFLDEKGALIGPLPGYRTPRQLELFLKLFKNDDYKKIKEKDDWSKYQSNFKYEFVE